MAKYSSKYVVKRMLKMDDGYRTFILSIVGGRTITEYNYFINQLNRSDCAWNTVEAYAQDLSRFYDYLFCAEELIFTEKLFNSSEGKNGLDWSNELVLQTPLSLIFNTFPSFLIDGTNSRSLLARKCAEKLKHRPLSNKTAQRIISSVTQYVSQSAVLQLNLLAYKDMDIIDVDISADVFGKELLEKRVLTEFEQRALLKNSYLAGCIRSGSKYVNSRTFKIRERTESTIDRIGKAFPLKYAAHFVRSFDSYRDKAIYALIFGGGLRPHEAYQIKITDIDMLNEEIFLSDPGSLSFAEGFYSQGKKGVAHPKVYLIEPFKSFLFDAIDAYLQYERPNSESQYLFLKSDKFNAEPYFTATRATKNQAFKDNLIKCGLGYLDLGPHSGRHMYAFYLRNFIDNGRGGNGLTTLEVQEYLRHKYIKSTRIYAVDDIDKFDAIINNANKLIVEKELSLDDIRNMAYEQMAYKLLGVDL
ncbi:site-specific integrase [Vibrio cholerae]|nr:site-specific integrase [Vibrio cholerae]